MTYEKATILRCEVGSTAHGTGLPGREDLDEMSIAVPDTRYVLGLRQWEQDIIRTDNGRSLGPSERSTPDTYESPSIRTTFSQRFSRMPKVCELKSFVDHLLESGVPSHASVEIIGNSNPRETFVALSATKGEETL